MICSITSPTLDTFKCLKFRPGLNVILSDQAPQGAAKGTTNSTGKSCIFELIHFLLGAHCSKGSLFRQKELINHRFRGEFDFWGKTVAVERTGADESRVRLSGDLRQITERSDLLSALGEDWDIDVQDWREILEGFLFRLRYRVPDDIFPDRFVRPQSLIGHALLSYFIRRVSNGGYIEPTRCAGEREGYDIQRPLSYLLGLDWEIASDFQEIHRQSGALQALRKAIRGSAYTEYFGTTSNSQVDLAAAKENADGYRSKLESFQVDEQYHEIGDRIAQAKEEAQRLTRDSASLRIALEYLRQDQSSEAIPDPSLLEDLYEAVGVELPGVARRQLNDVRQFYRSVTENRKQHLASEVQRITDQVARNEATVNELNAKRNEDLDYLKGKGVLGDFVELRMSLVKHEVERERIQNRIDGLDQLDSNIAKLREDKSELYERLQQDIRERDHVLRQATDIVRRTISSLYGDRTGDLTIKATRGGPQFSISISGESGGGIRKMAIFCFDLAIFEINSAKQRGPGFIAHDSHLFDGVDGRQVAQALMLGADAAKGDQLQYIVTMNTDKYTALPFPKKFDRDSVVLETRLSDETESGGLFGLRFN